MEVFNAGRTMGMHVDTHIEDGWIVLGDKPGLGITFDDELIDELAVEPTPEISTALPSGRRSGAGLTTVGRDELP